MRDIWSHASISIMIDCLSWRVGGGDVQTLPHRLSQNYAGFADACFAAIDDPGRARNGARHATAEAGGRPRRQGSRETAGNTHEPGSAASVATSPAGVGRLPTGAPPVVGDDREAVFVR
jgi:hypothetical protein